jgi:hypothetical protein
MMRQLQIKASTTNFNGTYFTFAFVIIGAVVALVGPGGGDWLYRIGLVYASLIGLLSGTTLAEIKVKPFSFCMPGQEKSMGPAIVTLAVIACGLYTCLLLIRPVQSSDALLIQQLLTLFCWSIGIDLLVVLAAVVAADTFITSTVLVVGFMLLVAGVAHPGIGAGWSAVSLLLIDRPVLAVVFASVTILWALRALRDRELSRRLCGSPFLPLKAYDNPFRLDEYKQRMRRTALKTSFVTANSGTPGGRLLFKLSERFAGSSWDYLLHESRMSGNVIELIGKVSYILVLIALVIFVFWRRQPAAPAMPAIPGLFFMVGLTFMFFAPGFRARLSPMLPVSRRQHFRALLVKAGIIYANAVLILLALRFLVGWLEPSLPLLSSTLLAGLVEMSVPAVLILALNVPVLCWSSAAFRSTIANLVFMMAYMVGGMLVISARHDALMAISLPSALLTTGVFWLPFLYIAFKRALRDDLLLQ